MLSDKMCAALNEQVKWELYSSYFYLSMSAYLSDSGLAGFAHWMRLQAQEELEHAIKFYDYILERGGKVALLPIEAPPSEWKSTLDVFEETLAHEQKVTSLINGLVDLAIEEKDHASNIFLQWFVTEQVEEEDNASDIVNKVKMVGKAGEGLFMLDKEMGARVLGAAAEQA